MAQTNLLEKVELSELENKTRIQIAIRNDGGSMIDNKLGQIVKIKIQAMKLRFGASWLARGGYTKEALKLFKKADKLEAIHE